MYDGEPISFNQFKYKFAYEAGMFGWDENIKAKMIKYFLKGMLSTRTTY